MSQLAETFSQLATGTFDAPPIRRALFEAIAAEFGSWSEDWVAPTGSSLKTTFNSDATTTVSNPPTQAEVQAINDRLLETRRLLSAVIQTLLTG